MSGTKRKGHVASGLQNGTAKKQKQEAKDVRERKNARQDFETEEDSDPIVESDTPEYSGEDDGVSWPSDEDDTGGQGNAGYEDDVEAELPAKISPKNAKSEDARNSTITPSTSSKESHAKQKALVQERKASKPNADSIARSKKLWERLRRKSHVPLEERKKLVAELFDIITGHVKDFVLKHDSVRVIQTAIKYANLDQRRMIARELKGEYRGLAESRYAKFLVGKLLVHGDKETRDLIVPEFYGHVRRMIKHSEASWILDDVYRGVATPSQKATMLREWYGAEFSIFKTDSKGPVSDDLKAILTERPEKRKPVMHALHEMINLLVQKKTTGFTMLHDAMLQYLLNVPWGSTEMTDFIELLKGDEEGDLLKNLAFTKSGARIVCLALAHGNAKDRKSILRVYRNTITAMAYDAHAHQVILTAYDVIDDTVLTSKTIFPELIGKSSSPELNENQRQSLLDAVQNLNARIPILYLFSEMSKSILSTEDLDLLDTIHTIRPTTSKKDSSVRRKELLSHISPPLLALIATDAETLIQSSFGCQYISEVLLSATAGDRKAALEALVALVHSTDPAMIEKLNAPSASRTLKTLVQGGRYNTQTKTVKQSEPPLGFHNMLFEALDQREKILEWAMGSNSFTVLSFLEAEGGGGGGGGGEGEGFVHGHRLRRRLQQGKKRLEEAAKGGEKVVKDKGGKGEKRKGNRGTQLLLERLSGV